MFVREDFVRIIVFFAPLEEIPLSLLGPAPVVEYDWFRTVDGGIMHPCPLLADLLMLLL